MSRADAVAARALAAAFLAGEWTAPDLLERARRSLGTRAAWLAPLTRDVMAAYHRPPADRPRELAAFVAAHPRFVRAADAARRKGRALRVREWPGGATRMVRSPWPVPALDDVGALADLLGLDVARLDWLADVRRLQRRTPAGRLHPYRYRWEPRPHRVPRLLEAPIPRLLAVQRTLLRDVLAAVPPHPAVHGFVPGRGVRTALEPHVGADVVLRLDLEAFFPSVTAARVYGMWRAAGYPEPVAHVLTGLVTVRSPVAVVSAMPAGGSPDERWRLRRRLAEGHLPAGAATSPCLANLVTWRLDARLAGYASAAGVAYTRYADDLVFSGGPALRRSSERFTAAVARIAVAEGFSVQRAKTRIRVRSQRQELLGAVVNERLTVPRPEYDRLRAVLHNALRTSGPQQNRAGHPDFRAQLEGRVAWVASLDPVRGARLRGDLDRVRWD